MVYATVLDEHLPAGCTDLMIPGCYTGDIRALPSAPSLNKQHMGQALIGQKRHYDVHAKSRSSFNEGDLIGYYGLFALQA